MSELLKRKVISIWDAVSLGYPCAPMPQFELARAIPQQRLGIDFPVGLGFEKNIAPVPAVVRFDDAILLPDGSIVTDEHYVFHGLTFVPHGGVWTRYAPLVVEARGDFVQLCLPAEVREVNDLGFQLVTGHGQNYGHFHHDVIARAYFAQFATELMSGSFKYICRYPKFPMQLHILNHVFGAGNILFQHAVSLKAKSCAVAALPSGPYGMLPESVEFAHKHLKSAFSLKGSKGSRRIFISRADGVANQGRLISNQGELDALLRRFGFESMVLSTNDPHDTISAFENAECVLGLHGAGLMNLMFCPVPTKIIELHPPHAPPWISRIGRLVGHEHIVFQLQEHGEKTVIDISDLSSLLIKLLE
ncbi:glycosyltransferase family 61 protein [uncultured Rhodoblastus sp.]|uniref:glycosyltransferase family 61 protein n=1 Tax=uncultured Rhodoblastus sp. TaxID=543037 RepID=UPI0025E749AE|nr:glycosyltransferase family 61 protein [uncultured Rhodoblastus sp.]